MKEGRHQVTNVGNAQRRLGINNEPWFNLGIVDDDFTSNVFIEALLGCGLMGIPDKNILAKYVRVEKEDGGNALLINYELRRILELVSGHYINAIPDGVLGQVLGMLGEDGVK